jgi:EAL domain-containing protein (putative c-di-GMP-specific phosphodiesterase class I)
MTPTHLSFCALWPTTSVAIDADAHIIRAVTGVAHVLQLSVCAQGVETRPMLEFVRETGFDSAQGHFSTYRQFAETSTDTTSLR